MFKTDIQKITQNLDIFQDFICDTGLIVSDMF